MLHPSLHGYLVDQHRRELERTAERERLLAVARQVATDTPGVAERTLLLAGSLLLELGQRLCARYPSEAAHTLPRTASHDMALSPLSTWMPAMLARTDNATESRTPTTFVYYGVVTVSPRGITRAEYVTPLAHPIASGRLGAGKRG